ncbi:MAG: hypothetical protein EZS28_011368 [Streblomastix strix]|uniref:Uncharacterized protein n=1 Tax=Streblomastix strix TaxID=222440 RepID=A0A5J4WDN8_9EUKA|nr:MAG: hypothetical protein EZS28_011368 [Streblomastix strix]
MHHLLQRKWAPPLFIGLRELWAQFVANVRDEQRQAEDTDYEEKVNLFIKFQLTKTRSDKRKRPDNWRLKLQFHLFKQSSIQGLFGLMIDIETGKGECQRVKEANIAGTVVIAQENRQISEKHENSKR